MYKERWPDSCSACEQRRSQQMILHPLWREQYWFT